VRLECKNRCYYFTTSIFVVLEAGGGEMELKAEY